MLIISSRFDYGAYNDFTKQRKKKNNLKTINSKQLLSRFNDVCAHIISDNKPKNKKRRI